MHRRQSRARRPAVEPTWRTPHPALDIAGFPQSIVKRAQTAAKKVGPFGAEHPDHRHRRLLRARRERPRNRRAAEKRDEIAPSNVTCHAPLPRRHALVKQYYIVIRSFASVARWPR